MFSLLAQLSPLPIPTNPAAGGASPTSSTPDLAAQARDLAAQTQALSAKAQELAHKVDPSLSQLSRLDVFHGYMGVFFAAFVVTLLATPVMRRMAIKHGIVDRPNEARKIHRVPIAYLGGVGVYLGLLAGILFAYSSPFHGLIEFHPSKFNPDTGGIAPGSWLPGGVPVSVLVGITVIMLCGLVDDVVGLSPRYKIAGMLFAAAALALEDVGVKLAAGLIIPIAKSIGLHTTALPGGFETILLQIPGTGGGIDLVYWIGTAVIAMFVLGGCNASNLIDGLDGLLSGVTAIAATGLLVLALGLAIADDGPRDSARIVLCLSLLGACLGFLPHNFNPATIFLGDTGSLMLGYVSIVIILTLGDTGKTHLVLAGLVIYAIPIIDTTLAIVRRKMAGKSISDADDQHLHHMLKRAFGVKGAALTLYAIGGGFAIMGILMSEGRQRVIYAIALVFAAFIGVTAMKIGRKAEIERQMAEAEAKRTGVPIAQPVPASASPQAATSSSEQPARATV